jgi:hypothetical protein
MKNQVSATVKWEQLSTISSRKKGPLSKQCGGMGEPGGFLVEKHIEKCILLLLCNFNRKKVVADLKECPEGGPADGTIVGLVAEGVGACVAEAQMATRQDDRVPGIAHADHTLCTCIGNKYFN